MVEYLIKLVEPSRVQKDNGEVGHRSPYLLHAKQALYHLSYIPGTLCENRSVTFSSTSQSVTQMCMYSVLVPYTQASEGRLQLVMKVETKVRTKE